MVSAECFASLSLPFQLKALFEAIQSSGGGGFVIPTYDYQEISYVGSTNNIDTIVYKTGGSGGTTVATQTLTYVGGTPASDDALIETVTIS